MGDHASVWLQHTEGFAARLDLSELPGRIRLRISDDHSDLFPRNLVAVLVEHDASPFRPPMGCQQVFPRSIVADPRCGGAIATMVNGTIDEYLRPWRAPDPNPFPALALFPRLAAVARVLGRRR